MSRCAVLYDSCSACVQAVAFVLFNMYGVAITSEARSEERQAYKLALNKV